MTIRRLASLLLCGLLSACGTESAVDQGDLVREGGSEWAEYYAAGDLDGLMTLYVDDVVVALHGQPALYGKQAVRDYFSTRIGKAEAQFELDYEVIETHGDIAYIISKYWLHAVNKESGDVYKEAGRSLLVYKRQEGQWKIAADIDQLSPDVAWPSPAGMD